MTVDGDVYINVLGAGKYVEEHVNMMINSCRDLSG